MKKIIFQNFKQGYFRIAVLLIIMLSLSSIKMYAQLTINQVNGWGVSCTGENSVYALSGTTANTTYQWTIYKFNTSIVSTANTITLLPNNQASIQWLVANVYGYTISVTGGGQTATYSVQVLQTPNPYITTDNVVGCQISESRDQGLSDVIIVDDIDGCVNVCENTTVNYIAHGQANSYFVWTVTGGVFSNGLTTISGSPNTPFIPMNNVNVTWGPQGPGNITCTEHSNFIVDCPSVPKTICFNIIEKPRAFFTFDIAGPDYPEDLCYDICLNQTVNFINLSTASSNSPIIHYQWDFGDNTYSQLENPSHKYILSGNFTVTLTVTNKCGCTHTFKRQICVSDKESLIIKCPSIACENDDVIYSTMTNCNPYTWSVIGGHIIGQTDPEVTIKWDNVDPDGFGYVTLDGANCNEVCPSKTTIKVPVILTVGQIKGPTDVCVNKNYIYRLPAWPATNFTWTLINNSGNTISSYDENRYEVEIKMANTPGTFTLKCNYVNTIADCSGEATLIINVTDQPTIVNPPAEICKNNAGNNLSLSTSIAPSGSNAINWIIMKPNGTNSTFPGAGGSASINITSNTFSITGTYIIKADYTSGVCDPEEIRIKVKDLPPSPTFISGENPVCLNYPYTYNGDILQSTILSWSVTGGSFVGSNTGNSVTVIWTSTGTKSLSCYRTWDNLPGCSSPAYTKPITHIVISGSIAAPAAQCEDGSYNYSITTNNTPESYEWSVSPSTAGSIGQGQGTSSCTITWNHIGTTTVTINCKLVKCGTISTISQAVQVTGSPTYTLTASPNPVCSGVGVGFTLNSSPAGFPVSSAGYSWSFGDNTMANTTPSATIHNYVNNSSSNSTYPVTLTITNGGCGNSVATVVTSVVVKPAPTVNISPGIGATVCTNSGIPIPYSITLTSAVSGSVSYQWLFNNASISGANTSTLTLTNSSSTLNGTYNLLVTGSNLCTSTSNPFVLTYFECVTSTVSCTPVGPSDYPILSLITPISCRAAQCTSTVTGSTNIWTYNWVAPTEPGYTGSTGSSSITSSPVYHFDKPGLYWIAEEIMYKNAADPNNPNNPCIKTGKVQVMIPLVADFVMNMVCYGNNSYKLSLDDHSSIYYTQSISNWEWFIDGSSTPFSIIQNVPAFTIASGTHSIKLKVTLTGGHYCETTQTIVVPNLPSASFTVSSTDPQSTSVALSSCSGNGVVFSNTSTVMSDLVKHVWTFGDNSSLHMQNGIKVYTTNNSFSVNLTVTDLYGCTNSNTKSIYIYNNTLAGNTYSPTTQIICPGQSLLPISPIITGGYTIGTNSIQSQWYYGTSLLGTPQYTTTFGAISLTNAAASGAYWVKVTDAHGCYKNINPFPATVSIKNPPTAIIDGKQDFCQGDEIKLKAITGVDPSTVSYLWHVNTGATYVTREIDLTGMAPGNYTITLTVSQSSGCSATSAPYPFTIHYPPSPATLSVSAVDCNNYQLQLQASTGLSPAYFNWSDGQSVQTPYIYHGGAYRLWMTDQYGCQSKSDIQVPEAPETYFWRFPVGCYTFCPGDLPKWVDGDKYQTFSRWEWYFNGSGNIIPNNGPNTYLGYGNPPYQGGGANTISDRLLIDLPNNGMGSGDYTWMLDNGLCSQETDKMNVTIPETCCDIKMEELRVECIQNGTYSLTFTLDNNTPGCPNAWYNLTVIDPNTNLSIGSFIYTSPGMLGPGINPVSAQFHLLQYASPLKFKIEVFCNGYEHCIGYAMADIPECGEFAINHQVDPSVKAGVDTEISADLNIMPNPANSQLTINYRFSNASIAGKKSLHIYDVTARPVKEVNLENNTGTISIDVSHFAQGIYFIELRDENKHILSKRLLINR